MREKGDLTNVSSKARNGRYWYWRLNRSSVDACFVVWFVWYILIEKTFVWKDVCKQIVVWNKSCVLFVDIWVVGNDIRLSPQPQPVPLWQEGILTQLCSTYEFYKYPNVYEACLNMDYFDFRVIESHDSDFLWFSSEISVVQKKTANNDHPENMESHLKFRSQI